VAIFIFMRYARALYAVWMKGDEKRLIVCQWSGKIKAQTNWKWAKIYFVAMTWTELIEVNKFSIYA